MSLAQRIRQRREQLAMSQSALARRTGVPQSRISEFENGSKTGMTLDTAKRLARVLGVSIDYLAGTWDEEAEAAPAEAPPTAAAGTTARQLGRPRKAARAPCPPRPPGAGLPPAATPAGSYAATTGSATDARGPPAPR